MNIDRAESRLQSDRIAMDFPLFASLIKGEPEKGSTRYHFSQWRKYHELNPKVWIWFQQFAYQAIDAGHDRYSADAILHRIRWHVAVEVKSDGDFRVNNNHSAYYGRLFTKMYPNHGAFFETRELTCGVDEAWLDYELSEIAHLSTKEFHRP